MQQQHKQKKTDASTSSSSSIAAPAAAAAAASAASPRKRIRKPTRAAAGSWETCAELDDLLRGDAAHRVPAGANLYDLRSSLPYFFDNSRHNEPLFEAITKAAAEAGVDVDAAEEEKEGAKKRRIVQWETNAVLETVAAEVGGGGRAGTGSSPPPSLREQQSQHPINRKVGLRVHLGDLAREAGLSDAAARWVALVAGPRYDPRSGVLRLTDERGGTRAENARSCAGMLSALVAEGRRKHP